MPRTEGTVLERRWKKGRGYALRFHALGRRQYMTLGFAADGWTRERAETELANVLADVRRGLWVPPQPVEAREAEDQPRPTLTFGQFALERLASRQGEVSDSTVAFERWALDYHLLPFFATTPIDEIDIAMVDDYRRHKIAESERRRVAIERKRPMRSRDGNLLRPLAASTINKTIDVLQGILALALEYGHVVFNAAAGRRRRLKLTPRRPAYLDGVDQIQATLDAAARLDRATRYRGTDRLAIVSTLIFGGLRATELCCSARRDWDMANDRAQVSRSKTQAGLREFAIVPILHSILVVHLASRPDADPDDLAFPTLFGTPRDKDNIRSRVVAPVIDLADQLLRERRQQPLPQGITPHKLRHTFASIRYATGEDPTTVMQEIGHTDPRFTLRVYAHMMRRSPEEKARLKTLVNSVAVIDGQPLLNPPYEPPALALAA